MIHFQTFLGISALFTFHFCATKADLRFCHNGPHIMKDGDCPGGFVFKESIKPTCKYYVKTGNHSGIVLSTPADICDDASTRIIEDEGDDMADIETFSYLSWEEFDANETKGAFPENVCMDECLPDWEADPVIPDEDPIPEDWDPASVPDAMKEKLAQLNRDMFLRVLMDENYEIGGKETIPPTAPGQPPLPPLPNIGENVIVQSNIQKGETSVLSTTPRDPSQLNLMKLLSRSFKAATSICGPFVKEDFYEQILKGMIVIMKSIQSKIVDVGFDLYRGIAKILDHCGLKHHQEFILNGTKCEGKEQVEGIYYPKQDVYWPYRLTGRSFRWGKYHPVLDATWTTLDIVQSFCFDNFMENAMLSSTYQMAIEELFPEKIQLFWRVNPPVKNDKLWNNLLQTYDLNITMKNLDACAIAARNSSPYHLPLPRPFLTEADLDKPEPPPKPLPDPEKGWNKTIEKYWENYEKRGGFKKISEKFGTCFQTTEQTDELTDMLQNLKRSC